MVILHILGFDRMNPLANMTPRARWRAIFAVITLIALPKRVGNRNINRAYWWRRYISDRYGLGRFEPLWEDPTPSSP